MSLINKVSTVWNKGTLGICKPNKTSFKKGCISWNKGLTSKDDYRIMAGRLHPNYAKPSAMRGKNLSEEVKKKMSLAMIGNKHALGIKRSFKFCQGISNRNKKRIGSLNPNFGLKRSEETKEKIRLSKIGKPRLDLIGKKHSEKSIQKMREKRKWLIMPKKDTKPEKVMQTALTLEDIKFKKHKPFKIGKTWHQVDIFIEPNICIEVDGIYWHNRDKAMKRDLQIDEELLKQGFKIFRFTDNEIYKDARKCVIKIKEVMHAAF